MPTAGSGSARIRGIGRTTEPTSCKIERMQQITVRLDEAAFAVLRSEAEAQDLTVEAVVSALAEREAARIAERIAARTMASAHLERYPDAFRRLAEG